MQLALGLPPLLVRGHGRYLAGLEALDAAVVGIISQRRAKGALPLARALLLPAAAPHPGLLRAFAPQALTPATKTLWRSCCVPSKQTPVASPQTAASAMRCALCRSVARSSARGGAQWHVTHTLHRTQVMSLLFAGSETTAQTLAFLFHCLAAHPAAQRTAAAEAAAVLGSLDSAADVSAERVRALRFIGACISETLRLYPVAVDGPRVAAQDDQLGGFAVPKGVPLAAAAAAAAAAPAPAGADCPPPPPPPPPNPTQAHASSSTSTRCTATLPTGPARWSGCRSGGWRAVRRWRHATLGRTSPLARGP